MRRVVAQTRNTQHGASLNTLPVRVAPVAAYAY
jgi:hypothetical protein